MTRVDELRELFAYNAWARDRILDAAVELAPDDFVRDMSSSFPSVRDTLVHIMSAEWVWLSRLQGMSPAGMPDEWKTLMSDGVRAEWRAIDDGFRRSLDSLAETDLDRVVEYRNLAGQPMSSSVLQILRHVVNHSTYHRGQITTLLRQLGAMPPATDLIVFYRTVPLRAV